jgi:hypothetical protein
MATDLATLLQSKTADTILTELLADLQSAGFPVTAWQPGNAGRTLAKVDARALASLYARIAEIARGGYLDLAAREGLTLPGETFTVTLHPTEPTHAYASEPSSLGSGDWLPDPFAGR